MRRALQSARAERALSGRDPRVDAVLIPTPQVALNFPPRSHLPRISEFFGISIYLHWRDHSPPHFHAIYAGEESLISIDSLSVISGSLPPRPTALVLEWATLHQDELRMVWLQAQRLEPLDRIAPLR
jgi:hypothetical protein